MDRTQIELEAIKERLAVFRMLVQVNATAAGIFVAGIITCVIQLGQQNGVSSAHYESILIICCILLVVFGVLVALNIRGLREQLEEIDHTVTP